MFPLVMDWQFSCQSGPTSKTQEQDISSKLQELEKSWELSQFHKSEILNLPLPVAGVPSISTLSNVQLFLPAYIRKAG